MIIRGFFILLFILAIIGCETEHERKRRLRKEEDRVKVEFKKQENEYKRYEEQQHHMLYSTAKERFAYLYDLKKYNGKRLEYYDYIKNVELIEVSKSKYRAVVKMYSAQDLKINFYLFLHDDKGLLVGQYRYYNRVPLMGRLKKLQTTEKEFTVKTTGVPSYFRVALVYK
ncbi:hypothetical protein [Candidatus Uabimicrobium sp. HlEnr_7]|uniref:hypothetical protein n=1 Tax=Candidatus Uabimicrobium helgolandensis TaxID=3095367 RepID=UPI003558B15B